MSRGRRITTTVALALLAVIALGMAGAFGKGACYGYSYADNEACDDAATASLPRLYLELPSPGPVSSGDHFAYVVNTPAGVHPTFEWDFGDDGSVDATGPDASHMYTTPGSYDVKVTATLGSTTIVRKRAVIVQALNEMWLGVPYDARAGSPRYLDVYYDSPLGAKYAWDFGDGATAGNETELQHAWAAPGLYKVSVTVTPTGEPPFTRWDWVDVAADRPATAGMAWRPTVPMAGDYLHLFAAGYDPDQYDKQEASFAWIIDGAPPVTTTDGEYVHQFTTPGDHAVEVRATMTQEGETVSRTRTIAIADLAAGDHVSAPVAAGAVVSTGGDPTPADPVETTVTSARSGAVTIHEAPGGTEPAGFNFYGQQIDISAPDGYGKKLLTLAFRIDPSALPAGTAAANLAVFRSGKVVRDCAAVNGFTRYPCVAGRTTTPAGDFEITVTTRRTSPWHIGLAETAVTGPSGNQAPAAAPTPAPAAAAPSAAATVTLSVGKQKLRRVLAKGLRARVGCSAACTLAGSLSIDAKTTKRLKLKRTVGSTKLALPAAGSRMLTVRIAKKAARKLRRARRATFTLTLTGGAATVAKRVVIKR